VWWEVLIVGLILLTLPTEQWFAEWFTKKEGGVLFGVVCLPLAMALDAAIYHLFGNTPGKALLGVQVVSESGSPLMIDDYLIRNYRMLGSGLAFGIPLINLITLAWQHDRLKKGLKATYDQTSARDVRVIGRSPLGSVIFTLAFVGLFLAMLVVNGILNRLVDKTNLNSGRTEVQEVLAQQPAMMERSASTQPSDVVPAPSGFRDVTIPMSSAEPFMDWPAYRGRTWAQKPEVAQYDDYLNVYLPRELKRLGLTPEVVQQSIQNFVNAVPRPVWRKVGSGEINTASISMQGNLGSYQIRQYLSAESWVDQWWTVDCSDRGFTYTSGMAVIRGRMMATWTYSDGHWNDALAPNDALARDAQGYVCVARR
jgi:hypothetical protein